MITHETFIIERTLDASPDRVFRALANPETKAKWFVGPQGWTQHERTMDFRVGGAERLHGTHVGGMESIFEARYFDIVPNERVVYVYEMIVNGQKISTSLATFEIQKVGDKTKLVLTEQGAYFGDKKQAEMRAHGTETLIDQLVLAVT